jgi:hypothetical protein
MNIILLLLLSLLLVSSLYARQIIDISTGKVSKDSVLQAPEKDVEYVGDGIAMTIRLPSACGVQAELRWRICL